MNFRKKNNSLSGKIYLRYINTPIDNFKFNPYLKGFYTIILKKFAYKD